MLAAAALLVLMVFTVMMFEVTVNNRHRAPKPPAHDETELPEVAARDVPDLPKP
ncbi:hypothetical protein [Sphaerisporangium corydalis]|uniref:Uncharacterized protein n=1 Tax=Sphaerisporangium corydalis TaxID=1441875 RepID=A0ABV9EGA6_9ACTN|nr:hypothetical protein [Sphaerisporangium corydalis]